MRSTRVCGEVPGAACTSICETRPSIPNQRLASSSVASTSSEPPRDDSDPYVKMPATVASCEPVSVTTVSFEPRPSPSSVASFCTMATSPDSSGTPPSMKVLLLLSIGSSLTEKNSVGAPPVCTTSPSTATAPTPLTEPSTTAAPSTPRTSSTRLAGRPSEASLIWPLNEGSREIVASMP